MHGQAREGLVETADGRRVDVVAGMSREHAAEALADRLGEGEVLVGCGLTAAEEFPVAQPGGQVGRLLPPLLVLLVLDRVHEVADQPQRRGDDLVLALERQIRLPTHDTSIST